MSPSAKFSAPSAVAAVIISLIWQLQPCAAVPAQQPPEAPAGRGGAPAAGPRQGNAGTAIAPAKLLEMFDADKDDRVSKAEAPERMQDRWAQIDSNNDGYASLAEFEARDARSRPGGRPSATPALPVVGETSTTPAAAPATRGGVYQPASDFSVITVGTGSPRYESTRSGPATMIQYMGSYYLLDMGNGTQSRLYEIGISPRKISGLLITHHHLDHNEEFIPMFINTRLMGSKPPIIGTPGTRNYVDFIMGTYAEDVAYRLGRKGKTLEAFQPLEVREVKGGESFILDGMKVTTAKVNHSIHTVAYRFDADNQSIVVSGDLSYSESLVNLAHHADVLVIDSGGLIVRQGAGARPNGAGGRSEGGGRPSGGAIRGESGRLEGVASQEGAGGSQAESAKAHATAQDVATMAAKAGVKRLVLTHIAPGEVDEAATIQAARPIYQGEVMVAHDLLEIAAGANAPAPAAAPGNGKARVHVKVSAAATTADGKSWATAFPTVTAGLDAAEKLGGGEVWVAKGIYQPSGTGDRAQSFRLRKGVDLLGGFDGTETAVSQRDWGKHVTVLSGDIGRPGEATDNSYNVVTGANEASMDGFTIAGGYALDGGGPGGNPGGAPGGKQLGGPRRGGGQGGGAPGAGAPIHITPQAVLSGPSHGSGAGLIIYQCAPEIRNCTFRDNQAGKGGAVYNMTATSFPPRPGTAAPAPAFTQCKFIGNHARGRGGAVANDLGTSPVFRDCVFSGNTCDGKGGAIYDDFSCSPVLANCLFTGNQADGGGAIGNDGGSSPLIVHCTFSGNKANHEGAALYQGTGPSNNPTVTGCILWGNRCDNGPAEFYNWHDNDPIVSGSCVEGGWPGAGNVNRDPQFVDPAKGDFSLRAGSPCAGMGYTATTTEDQLQVPRKAMLPPSPALPRPLPPATLKAILRVDARNTAGRHDGTSWATAYATLSDALAAAAGQPREIWVAAGLYRPGGGNGRAATFQLAYGMEIYGGFSGRENERAARDWKTHVTILSGDLGSQGDASDNCYHVVCGEDAAVLDGFTLRDGNANGSTYDGKGGAMINYRRGPQVGPMGAATGCSPKVSHCLFENNQASEGGAVYNYDRGTPQFTDCRFLRNRANYGGAMVDRVGVRAVLTDCVFTGNQARWRGGAVFLDYGARPKFTGCVFTGNQSACHGGAVAMVSRASQLENTIAVFEKCRFEGNTAAKLGGAMAAADSAIGGLENCELKKNSAGTGGGGLALETRARIVTVNCRQAGNSARSGEAETANDGKSILSTRQSDWPDQGAVPSPTAPPRGFGPPVGAGRSPR